MDPAVLALLGPEVAARPMSDDAFVAALRLRSEQERTKQEQVRLDIAAKNLAIVELAVKHDVPPHQIAAMCVGAVPDGPAAHLLQQHQPRHAPRQLALDVAQTSAAVAAAQAGISVSQQHLPFLAPLPSLGRGFDADNASAVAPINFRFGGAAKPVPLPAGRRPLLPAKIGAAAVASLANPVTPYRPTYRTVPQHQRHFSMPAETSAPRSSDRPSARTRQHGSATLQLPLGATSSMQVRPTPAQPLHKQTKNSQLPLQESMTSFQHVIQFHHWKPEEERTDHAERAERGGGSISLQSLRGLFSHKRHKLNDMSIDLLLVPQAACLPRAAARPALPKKEEADVSMDTSDVTLTEPKPDEEPKSRFPHDILQLGRH